MEPIFKIKTDLDPFDLYGGQNMDSGEDIESVRLRLAMIKAKNKLKDSSDEEIFSQVDQDLQKVFELENESDNNFEAPHMRVVVHPKLDLSAEVKLMTTIRETFSQIFQALIVMLESMPENAATDDQIKKKRSKEFEVRLNRSVFETKQQLVSFQSALVKYSHKPKESKSRAEVCQRLHAVLRCTFLILQSYLRHLPYSEGHVFPPPLFKFIEICHSFAKSAKNLGLANVNDFQQDVDRLCNAAKAFQRKFEKKPTSAEVKKATNKKATKKSPRISHEMINNLARERFGSPRSGKSLTSLLRKKRNEDQVTECSDHVNSTLMDGESLGPIDHFANTSASIEQVKVKEDLDVIKEDDVESDKSVSKRSSRLLLQNNHLYEDEKDFSKHESSQVSKNEFKVVKEMRARKLSVSKHSDDFKSDEKSLQEQGSSQKIMKNSTRNIMHSKERTIRLLEIDEEELKEIEEVRHEKMIRELKSLPPSMAHVNPVELVSSVADKMVLQIVNNVCLEAVDHDLIRKLMQAELITPSSP